MVIVVLTGHFHRINYNPGIWRPLSVLLLVVQRESPELQFPGYLLRRVHLLPRRRRRRALGMMAEEESEVYIVDNGEVGRKRRWRWGWRRWLRRRMPGWRSRGTIWISSYFFASLGKIEMQKKSEKTRTSEKPRLVW